MPKTPAALHRRLSARSLSVLCVALALVSGSAPARAQRLSVSQAKLWTARYDGPGNSYDRPYGLGVSPDGATVFVTGYSTGSSGSSDYVTVAYDAATGIERWLARYNGPGNDAEVAYALKVSADGATVFVTGASTGSSGTYDYATVAYDSATGAQRWVARYDGPGNNYDTAAALGLSSDGATVFVTGESTGSGGFTDYATVAYAAATGAQRWVARYDGQTSHDGANALGVSPDGTAVFVAGSSIGSGTQYDYATVAYDAATGTQQWVTRYQGQVNGSDSATALGVSPDGATVFVTGSSPGSGTLLDYATVAYDAATGTQQWEVRYNGPGNGIDLPYALRMSPDGGTVFVTGSSPGSSGFDDYATVAYEAASGTQRWAARYDGPIGHDDDALALGVSADGVTVFVTGASDGAYGLDDYATVAYEAATGRRGRVGRINNGWASALEVSPDGAMLFVTGSVGTTNVDYGTVAYSLSPS